MHDAWRIEFVEVPLDLGFLDNLAFGGRDASHSFLRLVNDSDETVEELHGLSYDSAKKLKKDFSSNFLGRIIHGLKSIFDHTARQKPYDPTELQVFRYHGAHTEDPKMHAQSMTTGSESEMRSLWQRALREAGHINSQKLEYKAVDILDFWSAQNCHSVSAALLESMALRMPPEAQFARPGFAPHRLHQARGEHHYPAFARAFARLATNSFAAPSQEAGEDLIPACA